jgi:hypothetical protein
VTCEHPHICKLNCFLFQLSEFVTQWQEFHAEHGRDEGILSIMLGLTFTHPDFVREMAQSYAEHLPPLSIASIDQMAEEFVQGVRNALADNT